MPKPKSYNIRYLNQGYKPQLHWLSTYKCFQIMMLDGGYVTKFVDAGKELRYALAFGRRYGDSNVVWRTLNHFWHGSNQPLS